MGGRTEAIGVGVAWETWEVVVACENRPEPRPARDVCARLREPSPSGGGVRTNVGLEAKTRVG
jgi:hypothetical protein